jgi:hypothetical protein
MVAALAVAQSKPVVPSGPPSEAFAIETAALAAAGSKLSELAAPVGFLSTESGNS